MRLLWTGGWDSSFRLLQLLLVEGAAVQPIYAVSLTRRTAMVELQTMERMRRALLARLDDPSRLLPTTVVVAEQHPPRPELTALWTSLRRRVPLGVQYLWLAELAEALDWRGVELCIEKHPGGPGPWERAVFDAPGSLNDSPEAALFARWSFPVIGLTKEDMGALARRHGFYDVLVQRWFCQDPLMGRACGRCRPCSLANRDGVDFAPAPLVLARRAWLKAAGATWRRAPRAGRAPTPQEG